MSTKRKTYSIKNYIEKYNFKRLHSAIDNKTPNAPPRAFPRRLTAGLFQIA